MRRDRRKDQLLQDAEIALTVEQHAASLNAFVTWNAKHFAGKISVPVLTPRESCAVALGGPAA